MAIKNETSVDNLKINYLSEALYQEAVRNGEINLNEIYMTPENNTEQNVEWNDILNKPSSFNPTSHTHYKSQISDFPSSMPASDVYSWAKERYKPSYTKSEIGLGNVDNTADRNKSVSYAQSAGSASSVSWTNVNGKPSTFPPSTHSHSEYASASHSHSEYLNSSFNGYNSSDLTNPSYFAVWSGGNTNPQLRTLSTGSVCSAIGAAPSSHSHSGYASANHSHSGYASSSHTHDDRYYTESEIDTKLNEKANTNHSHMVVQTSEPWSQNVGDIWFIEEY